jgi:hypothetical protein
VTLQPKGLLVEEARTNLATYSEDFTNASWTKVGTTTVVANTNVSPDGTTTTDTINFPAGSDWVWKSFSGAASTAYTFSIWLSGSGTTDIGIYDTVSAGGNRRQITLTSTPTRYTYAATTGAASADFRVFLGRAFGASNATTVYAWGAQLEAGAFATSYIPTVASTVTRSADVATINGSLFSQWYGQTEGSWVSSFSPYAVTGTVVAQISAATNNDRFQLLADSAGQIAVSAGGAGQGTIDAGTVAAGATNNLAYAYRTNDTAASLSGGAAVADTTVTLPVVDRLCLGATVTPAGFLNGHIRSVNFIPVRLADFQLQALTA